MAKMAIVLFFRSQHEPRTGKGRGHNGSGGGDGGGREQHGVEVVQEHDLGRVSQLDGGGSSGSNRRWKAVFGLGRALQGWRGKHRVSLMADLPTGRARTGVESP